MEDQSNSHAAFRRGLPFLRLALASCLLNPTMILAQAGSATTLIVDSDNVVAYLRDAADPTRFATSQTPLVGVLGRNFNHYEVIGDIVSVNGVAVRGTWRATLLGLVSHPTPQPGQGIADTFRTATALWTMEILQLDGTPIGTIFGFGLTSGDPPPGSPSTQLLQNVAVVGGTGAFFGARGQMGVGGPPRTVASPPRPNSSVAEDPSLRRALGGGGLRRDIVYFVPMERPEILEVLHSDLRPVSPQSPARAGETLILRVRGLGPTVPGIERGQPFPFEPLAAVNSPVEATVNGRRAELINKLGWPGSSDTYRVDIRVPDGVSGQGSIRLTAAWISGSEVTFAIQQ